jgi:glutamyl/glutaminyl-tRNA synthetase
VAVTGSTISPPIDLTVAMIGRERTLSRIDYALVSRPCN